MSAAVNEGTDVIYVVAAHVSKPAAALRSQVHTMGAGGQGHRPRHADAALERRKGAPAEHISGAHPGLSGADLVDG